MGRSLVGGTSISESRLGPRNRHLNSAMTVTATLVLNDNHPQLLFLTPTAAREVRLPPEVNGAFFVIVNTAPATHALTVKEDSGTTTIGTVAAAGKIGLYYCDGTTWYGTALP